MVCNLIRKNNLLHGCHMGSHRLFNRLKHNDFSNSYTGLQLRQRKQEVFSFPKLKVINKNVISSTITSEPVNKKLCAGSVKKNRQFN